jgi:hypothetical protein
MKKVNGTDLFMRSDSAQGRARFPNYVLAGRALGMSTHFAAINRFVAEVFLDAQKLVVLGDPICAAQ